MNIVERLFGLRTKDDFTSAVASLRAEKAQAETTMKALRAQLRTAPFDRPVSDIGELRQELRAAEDQVETLAGLLTEAEARLNDPKWAEREAAARKVLGRGREARDLMRQSAKEFDGALARLIDACNAMRRSYQTVQDVNKEVAQLGFEKLKLICPEFNYEVGPEGEQSVHINTLRANYGRTTEFEKAAARGDL